MKYRLILILFLIASFNYAFAEEQSEIDSLEYQLRVATHDTGKIKILIRLSGKLRNKEPDKSMDYSRKALEILEEYTNSIKDANNETFRESGNGVQEWFLDKSYAVINNMGLIWENKGNYSEALNLFRRALDLAATISNEKYMIYLYNNIGNVLRKQGEFDEAMKYYLLTLKYFDEKKDSVGIAGAYNNIGIIFQNQNRLPEALDYNFKSLKIYEEQKIVEMTATSFNNIAVIYYYQNEVKKSLKYFQKALEIHKKTGNLNGVALACNNIAELNANVDNYTESLEYYNIALELNEKLGNKRGLSITFSGLGYVNSKIGNDNIAIDYLIRSVSLSKEIGARKELREAYLGLSNAYDQAKKYEESLEYYKLYSNLKDTLFNSETNKSINELQIRYETEKKEKEIELLTKDKRITALELRKKTIIQYSLVIGVIFLIALGLIIYNRYLVKKHATKQLEFSNNLLEAMNKNLEEEKQKVEHFSEELKRSNKDLQQFASVASHDLKEPLRKIRYFGERLTVTGDIKDKDKDTLDRINNAASRMNTLVTDLLTFSRVTTKAKPFEEQDVYQIIQDVLSDLEIRIKETKGKVNVDQFPNMEVDKLQIRQLFQNLISNALKFHRPGVPPIVKIKANQTENEHVLITVEDNGIGFDQKYAEEIFKPFMRLHTRQEYEGTGMGTAICDKIVERHGGEIKVKSEEGMGSAFFIKLPIRQKINAS